MKRVLKISIFIILLSIYTAGISNGSVSSVFLQGQLLNQMQNQISEVNENINNRMDFFEYTLGIFGAVLGILGGIGYVKILSWIKNKIDANANEKILEISDVIGDVVVGIGEFGHGSMMSAYRSLMLAYNKGFKSEMIVSYLAYLSIYHDISMSDTFFKHLFKKGREIKNIDVINYSSYSMELNHDANKAIKETENIIAKHALHLADDEDVKGQILKMRIASGSANDHDICAELKRLTSTNKYILLEELLFVILLFKEVHLCGVDCEKNLNELVLQYGGSRYFLYKPFVRLSSLDEGRITTLIKTIRGESQHL